MGAEALRLGLDPSRRRILAGCVSLLLCIGTLSTVFDYFVRWAWNPDLARAFDVHMFALADYIGPRLADHPVALDAPPWDSGTFRYAIRSLPPPYLLDIKHVFVERNGATILPPGTEYVLIGWDYIGSDKVLPPWLSEGQRSAIAYPGGVISFWPPSSLEEVPDLVFHPLQKGGASFGGVLEPTEIFISQRPLVPGEPSIMVLGWRALRQPAARFHISLRARDIHGRSWAELDEQLGEGSPPFPTTDWLADDTVYTAHALVLQPDTPLGRYSVAARIYRLDPLTPLQLEGAAGLRGEALGVGEVTVSAPAPNAAAAMRPETRVDMNWDGLTLLGYSLSQTAVQAGETFDLHLFWEAREMSPNARSISLELQDAGGKEVMAVEERPVAGAYPFSQWQPGDALHDIHRITIPHRAGSGVSKLIISLLQADGAKLMPSLGVTGPDIRSRPRQFDVPPELRPVGVRLGELARLEAYSTSELPRSRPWQVSLAWRALSEGPRSYAVTVQLLNEGGTLVAQHDGAPVEGEAPTSSWLAGEVVVDRHVLTLPVLQPGRYMLAVALYDEETGERLRTADDDMAVLAAYDLR